METKLSKGQALMERADVLAGFSEEPGRLTRRYGTPELVSALATVRGWMEAAGLEVRSDAVGNLIGRYAASVPGARTLALGSHVDSVRDAGRYDGPLGVLVALACVERLHAAGRRLPIALELIAFADEEGLRYRSSYLGSRVLCGLFEQEELAFVDETGVSLAEAMRAMGGDPDPAALAAAQRPSGDLIGYLEVHIEQGPVLEARDLPVGIVTSINGQSRGSAIFAGEAGHAGTVPMAMRHDALCAASELVLAIERAARTTDGLVATVGQIRAEPGAGNVIPGRATVSYDIRHAEDAQRLAACAALEREARAIAQRRGLGVEWELLQEHPAVPFDERLADLLAKAVAEAGHEPFRLASGAGHDAVSMAHLGPVAMLFVRCAGGISHSPLESIDGADAAVAVDAVSGFVELVAAEEEKREGGSWTTT